MNGPGQALFAFVRHWARRSGADGQEAQGRLVLVTEAVDALCRRGADATVNAVAHEIGIDQSGASRLVRAATDAGHLTTRAATSDARRRELAVTSDGHAMLKHAHEWQERVFDRLTAGWSDRRRREFHTALTDLVERSYEP